MRTFALALVCLACSSCVKEDKSATGPAPHATIQMRDGSTVTGGIVASSPAEITVAGDDKSSRTIAMTTVKSIQYDDPPVVAAPPPPAGTPPADPPPPPEVPHENHYHPAESVIHTKTYSLPVGTDLSVRTEETIDSGKAVEGQIFAGEITRDVLDASGDVVIPRGSNAQIVIRSASKGGKIKGAADLSLDMKSVSVDGREYALSTVDLSQRGRDGVGANRRTAEYSGGGAAIGAIIGAIAGGGKGAAIGAGSGAGAGALTQILTKGSIKVPAETVLTFKLDRPLRVVAR